MCANSDVPGMSYNHGLVMSSAAILYNITREPAYLDRALSLLLAASENLTNSDGAVADVQRGSRQRFSACSARGDPGTDFFSFKGVFVAHAAYFAAILSAAGSLPADAQQRVVKLISASSDNAWNHSAACDYPDSRSHARAHADAHADAHARGRVRFALRFDVRLRRLPRHGSRS
jgi:predicted alpha-1,6-mannanase (GH76 family)